MLYYRVLADDKHYANRWFLDEPKTLDGEDIDAREFTCGRPYIGPVPAKVPIQYDGPRVQFNLAAFDMPVVSEDIARILKTVAEGDLECFAVTIGESASGFSIVNAVHRVACVDERRSQVVRWRPGDGRPDMVGRYRIVSNLKIDPARTQDRHIFRIEGWVIALIVSEEVKASLERLPQLGVLFDPVC